MASGITLIPASEPKPLKSSDDTPITVGLRVKKIADGIPDTSTFPSTPSSIKVAISSDHDISSLKLTDAAESVFQAEKTKQIEAKAKLEIKLKTFTFVMGDVFSFGFLILKAIKELNSCLNNSGGASALTICGVIGGAFTAIVGFCDIYSGIETLRKKDITPEEKQLGWRLLLCGISEVLLGAFMITIAIIDPNSAIGMFFSDHKYMTSLIFLVPTLFFGWELVPKCWHLMRRETLAQQLHDDDLVNLKNKTELDHEGLVMLKNWRKIFYDKLLNPVRIENGETKKSPDIYNQDDMIIIMNKLESSIQTEAASAAFDLYTTTMILDSLAVEKLSVDTFNQEAQTEIINRAIKLDSKLSEWVTTQWVKISIQLAYLGSFVASMSTLSSTSDEPDAIVNIGLAVANLLPLYLDAFKHFLRNTPVVIKEIEKNDCITPVNEP